MPSHHFLLFVALALTLTATSTIACSSSGKSTGEPSPASNSSSAASSTSAGHSNAGTNATDGDSDSLAVMPADDGVVQQAAEDLHAKIIGAKSAGTLTMEAGKPLSIGLIAARDDQAFSDKNYAHYLATRLLDAMSQFNDAPYEIVALDADRQALVNKRLEEQGDAYDYAQVANSLGEQCPTNLGLFIEVRAKTETTEELSTRLYQVGRGTLVLGKSYPFDSPYLKFLTAGQAAEQKGDVSEAEQYYSMAVESRRGADPRAEALRTQTRAKLPPAELERRKDNEKLIKDAREQVALAETLWRRNRPGDRDKVKRMIADARDRLNRAHQAQPNNKFISQVLQDLETLIRKYQRMANSGAGGGSNGGGRSNR